MSNVQAGIITIGDELLIGQTIDTNSAWLAQQLNAQGILVMRRVAVGDTYEAIVEALDEELLKVDILILTGGLGPTSDDITKPLLAQYFGGKLVVNEEVRTHIYNLFTKRNRPILERNMKQAEVPDVCTVLFNNMGTAPGMWFEKDGKVIISLPGVPFEMKHIMSAVGLDKLAKRFQSREICHATLFTAGEGESYIAEQIVDIEEQLPPHIRLAYLPDGGMVRLRLTGTGDDATLLKQEVNSYIDILAERLKHIVLSREDIPLEHILGKLLLQQKATLGLAESCSGGYIGHLMTQISGSSAYFMGSIVSYDNSVKESVLGVKRSTLETQGAVSEQTVMEMAQGARRVLNTDFSISVSGVLGPNGGTEYVKVGTVWMAVANAERCKAQKYTFMYDRDRNKEMAAKMAMLMLVKFINGAL